MIAALNVLARGAMGRARLTLHLRAGSRALMGHRRIAGRQQSRAGDPTLWHGDASSVRGALLVGPDPHACYFGWARRLRATGGATYYSSTILIEFEAAAGSRVVSAHLPSDLADKLENLAERFGRLWAKRLSKAKRARRW